MAILSSTGIAGFLSSAKATGKQILNKAGKLIPEYIEDFLPGFAGHGWKIWNYRSVVDSEDREFKKYKLEIDSITVRESMTVFELLIQKIRAVKGALSITQASGKVATAICDEDAGEWLLTVEDEMSFVAHDIIRCQSWENGNLKGYWVEISEIRKIEEVDTIVIPVGEFSGGIGHSGTEKAECVDETLDNMTIPSAGDEIVQFGNSQIANRQSAVYIHADEGGQPAIDILFGITSKSFDGCVKTRIGGDIPGGDGAKGFYCENGMIKCVDDTGSLIYEFKPDGSFSLGKRKIVYDTKEDKLKFGTGVTLTWDNIAEDTKDNLKGDKGDKGEPGINGANGINGEDGISLLYKGEFDSHPTNPQNGWYYRNTVDKKCYVYQDGAWYVMTVDGSDGNNGVDGINGKDGNDGLSVVWKGDSSIPPSNPQKNWCYRDTDNGRVYIYNGKSWELMVADGNDGIDGTQGADGLSVFITYNDDPDEVDPPTGDGTTDGWHTDATSDVVWMSQKVAKDATSGTWGNPVRIKGVPGDDAVLYEIITPVAVISYMKNYGSYPRNMKLSVKKTIGNMFINITTDAAMSTEGLTLKYLNPMGEGLGKDYQPWNIDETMSSQYFDDGIKLCLFRGNFVVSHKELPLVTDGLDGDKGEPGSDANVPDWLKTWNGYATEIGSGYIVTPTMFSGVKNDDGTLTGVVQGRDCITIDGVKHSGMFGLKNGEIVFSIDETGNVDTNGDVIAKAIKATGLNVNDNFKVDKDGKITAVDGNFSGVINALSGHIGKLLIKDNNLVGIDTNGIERVKIGIGNVPNINDMFETSSVQFEVSTTDKDTKCHSGMFGNNYYSGYAERTGRFYEDRDPWDGSQWFDDTGLSCTISFQINQLPKKITFSRFSISTQTISGKLVGKMTIGASLFWKNRSGSWEKIEYFNDMSLQANWDVQINNIGMYELRIVTGYLNEQEWEWKGNVLFNAEAIWIVESTASTGCTTIAKDGILCMHGSNKYLMYSENGGFEARFNNYGLRVCSDGVQKILNGTWINL